MTESVNPIPPDDGLEPPPGFARFLKCRSIVDELAGGDDKTYQLDEIAKAAAANAAELLEEAIAQARDLRNSDKDRRVAAKRADSMRASLEEFRVMADRYAGKTLTAQRASLSRLDQDDLGEYERIAEKISTIEEGDQEFDHLTVDDEKALGKVYERSLPLGVLTEEQKEEIRVWNRKIAKADFLKCEAARMDVARGKFGSVWDALKAQGMAYDFQSLADAMIHYGLGDEVE